MILEKKLHLAGHRVRVLNLPRGLGPLGRPSSDDAEVALIAFVGSRSVLDTVHDEIVGSARADRLTWVAYPKGGQLGTDLSRDAVWKALSADGIRPVTNVSVDGVWTALRFRPIDAVRSRPPPSGGPARSVARRSE